MREKLNSIYKMVLETVTMNAQLIVPMKNLKILGLLYIEILKKRNIIGTFGRAKISRRDFFVLRKRTNLIG